MKDKYPKLSKYIEMMTDLLREINGPCMGCSKEFKFKKYENLKYSLLEEYIFCVSCYQDKIELLVYYGR